MKIERHISPSGGDAPKLRRRWPRACSWIPASTRPLTEAAVGYQLRDFDQLVEASRRGVASNPNEWFEHFYLGAGYEGTGKRLESISEYQKAVELSGGDQDATAALAHAYAGVGEELKPRRSFATSSRNRPTSYVSPYLIATLYAALGDKDAAFKFLEKAYQEKSLDLSWYLKVRFANR